MDHTHDLLVEIEENNISRLKIKLLRYFQSKKSNGGECDVNYTDGARTAVLRFRREQDQKSVLEKGSHQITVDNCVLNMTVRLLTDEATVQETTSHEATEKLDVSGRQSGKDEGVSAPEGQARGGKDETAAETICSTTALLGNIPANLSQNFLELLVENISRGVDSSSDCPAFTSEFFPDMASAVVTFQSGKEASDFVARCPENSRFKKMGLSVQLLEVTQQVLVEDTENISEDLLALYFENVGGVVESVVVNEVDQSAIITFKEQNAAQNILKKKHTISGKEIKVFAFHKSLGTAFYGEEKPRLKLPNAFTESIDCAVWTYINSNQSAAESIRRDLKEHFCIVNLDHSTVCLSPETTLHQQKDAKAIYNKWRGSVEATFAQSISKFRCLKLSPESEAWEESEEMIRQMLLKEDAVVVPDKAKGVISVAGPVSAVDGVEQSLYKATDIIRKRLQRQKSSITEAVKLPPAIFSVLVQGDVKEQLCSVYPQLEMSHSKGNPDLIVSGLPEEIAEVKKFIFNRILELKYQRLEMDCSLLDLLKEEQEEELTDVFLTSYGINAAFKISGNVLQLVAITDGALRDAEEHLVKLLITQDVDVEDTNVLKTPEWDHQVRQTETANNSLHGRIRIRTKDQKVVVCGYRDAVVNVSRKLKDFLEQNAHVEETVVIKPNSILNYIKIIGKSQLEQIQDKVALSYKHEAICLSGSRADVLEHKSLVQKLVSSVFFETLTLSAPGAKKLFKNLDNMSSNLDESGCLVQLVDETSGGQGRETKLPKWVFQLQTSDGTEIAVCKADICSYPVHAVVIYASQDLKLTSGLARALLNAAGSQLQEECDRLIRTKGLLKPGDHVITSAKGQLCCRSIIYAVAPRLDVDRTKHSKGVAQLKKAIKGSLELAEQNGCVSVALPALSSASGFPLKLSTETIINAVREYFDEKHEDVMLKRVHFVDACETSVEAIAAAVRTQFKAQCATQPPTPSPRSPPTSATSTSPRSPAHPKCLDHVQTKEGLNVTLVIGNIADATTDVTVNSVFRGLDLKTGAISNAIFQAAGPQLQVLLNAEKSSGASGDIIVTEGCQLKSTFVYHAVTCSWDTAQGSAQKILTGIFRDCLNMAEDRGMTSISFPTIGTGKLGFPKDLVAQLLYGEILKFSQKRQTKSLMFVTIIIYSGDTETQQVFTEELKKNFPKNTVSGHFSKIISSSGMYETKMGSVTIQAVTGDITSETTDVIVNSSNDKFTLKQGVSKAILEAAGQAVEDECQKLAASPNAGIIMTQPGNLQCKKIIHMVGQTQAALICKFVKAVLQMCVANSYTSVSFPAIGTGQGNVKAKEVADAMFDAVIDVLSQNTSTTLNTVRIVLFQPPMLKDFYTSMQQREATVTKPASWIGSTVSKFRALFSGSAVKPQKEDHIIKTVEVEPLCFHICGKSQAGVDYAKKMINDQITDAHVKNTITDNHICSLSQADSQRLTDIQVTLSVKIIAESKQGTMSLTIEGLGKDVLQATNEIQELLRKVREEEDLKVKVELAGKVAAWQYLQGTGFQNFDSMTNYKLEEALVSDLPSLDVSIQGQSYNVQMPSGPATDTQGNSLQIRRADKDEAIPKHWDIMPVNTSCHIVALAAGTTEYKQVQDKFRATCTQTIITIDRIQNPLLWKSLQIKKRNMEQKNGHQNNEKVLFHGTSEDTVPHINEHGFNRSYAGKNAAQYGNGTYFAVNANYSAQDLYSKPNQNGEKHMYLCRVLTGDHTLGQKGMLTPPPKTSNSVELYDSVVDNAKPHIFVVFHDNQAYPEYLIKFK